MKAFLDTNILLDILVAERPSHDLSMRVLQLARKRLLEIQVSTQSLTDTQYILSQKKTDFTAFAEMAKWMLNHVNIDGPDSFHIRDALEGYTGDFEDDLQYAFALDNACDIIITNDQDFIQRKTPGEILMMTPEEFIARTR